MASIAVWRFHNEAIGHFYTPSCGEGDEARGEYGMTWELSPNPAFFLYDTNDVAPGVVMLYRYRKGTHHFFSTELGGVPGASFEQIPGFISKTQQSNSIPLFTSYNPKSDDHFYTVDKDEWERSFGSDYTQDHRIVGYVPAGGPIICRPDHPKKRDYSHGFGATAGGGQPPRGACPLPPQCQGPVMLCTPGRLAPGGNCVAAGLPSPCGVCATGTE